MNIYFDTMHLYYLAQYLPVARELEARGHSCTFVVYRSSEAELQKVLEQVIAEEKLTCLWVESAAAARECYLDNRPTWLITGNRMDNLDAIHAYSKTALMQHGIGPKACYYDVSASQTSLRFVEGPHRLQRLQEQFPGATFIDSGYAKLDPLVRGELHGFDLAELGLDPRKPTLLYAPTFYPSSIECLPADFPAQIAGCNLLVKPHFFTYIKSAYRKQRKRLQQWDTYSNVYVAKLSQHSLLQFMANADILISDASSALFEFIALDKPAIWCDFYKLRWSYRGILKFRFNKRLDSDLKYFGEVATRVSAPTDLLAAIKLNLEKPNHMRPQRLAYTEKMVGIVDGNCSIRIADQLEANCNMNSRDNSATDTATKKSTLG